MAVIINTVDSTRFSLNGIEYFKNFTSFVQGNRIQIFNAYDRTFELIPYTIFSDVVLNGTTHANPAALQSAILPVIYTRDSLGSGGGTIVTPRITVFGNSFFLIKHPNNNNPSNVNTLEVNDMIANGFNSTSEFWYLAQYQTAGDINNVVNWDILNDQGL